MGTSVEKSELEANKMLSCKLRAKHFWEKEMECKMLGKDYCNAFNNTTRERNFLCKKQAVT